MGDDPVPTTPTPDEYRERANRLERSNMFKGAALFRELAAAEEIRRVAPVVSLAMVSGLL
jgi:hypothetical protein